MARPVFAAQRGCLRHGNRGADLGLVLRPGWTPQRLSMALQAAVDGFLLRYRVQPEDYAESRWEGAGLFADTYDRVA
jgi:hypothetical protein